MRIFKIISTILATAVTPTAWALELSGFYTDNMVIQRDTVTSVWGWAKPGAEVTVTPSWSKEKSSCKAASDNGSWSVEIKTPKAGGPYKIKVAEQGVKPITIKNVMSGEVWLCSGQSNMDMPLKASWGQVVNADEEIASASNPNIRIFKVTPNHQFKQQVNFSGVDGGWHEAAPATVGGFSAAAYFFARDLQERLGVPIGVIQTTWSGTPIEAWISAKSLEKYPYFGEALAALDGDDIEPNKLEKYHPKNDLDFYSNPKTPTVLYNAMIKPLAPFALKGAIWYQGEDNACRARQYRELLPTMVTDWEETFGQKLYFGIVQLANFHEKSSTPTDSYWAELREAQMMTAKKLGDYGFIACLIDKGEANDIHPRNKQVVGRRLAMGALNKAYGMKDIPEGGPRYRGHRIEKNSIIVDMFSNCYITYSKNGFPVKGMEIAGRDGVFYPADVIAMGETLIVSSHLVPNPQYVRYAWADNPECNLIDSSGLPAYPFRTDDFKMLCDDHKGY